MPSDREVRVPQRLPQRAKIFTPGNAFDLDESKIPAGMAYEWKRTKLLGQEDPENLIMAEQNGWTPVPAGRHPELAGSRAAPEAMIERRGQVLMEQPKQYKQEAREMDDFAARHEVESQIARLGLQARKNGARGIKRTMEVVGEAVGEVVE